jgi:hypothetical protein
MVEITITVKKVGEFDTTLVKTVNLGVEAELELFITEHLGGRPTTR